MSPAPKPRGSSGWRLKSVTITNFRGVLGSETFEFGGLPALVCGDNGVGKSTVALALEWTLFGSFPSGTLGAPKDGFMSPVGSGSKQYKGEVVLVRGAETLVIRRDSETGEFVVQALGKKKKKEEASELLDQILGLDMDTFVRAVLLQQNRIRGLLLDEPKERTKALDRLLGMDAAEAVLDSLKAKPLKDAAEAWRETITATEEKFGNQNELLEAQYKKAEQEARASKFMSKDMNMAGLANLYSELSEALGKAGSKYGVQIKPLPAADSMLAAKKVARAFDQVLGQIRVEAEPQKRLAPLETKAALLTSLLERWEEAVSAKGAIEGRVNAIVKDHGDAKAVATKRGEIEADISGLQLQLRNANELRALLSQALDYFKSRSPEICPVCDTTIDDQRRVRRSLEERVDSLTSKNVQGIERNLEKASAAYKAVSAVEKKLVIEEDSLKAAQAQVETERKNVMKALGRESLLEKVVKSELTKAIQELAQDREAVARGVATMEKELQLLAERDRAIRDSLVPFLVAREAVAGHEKAWKEAKKTYAVAEKQGAKLETLATDVDRIRKAVLAAKDEIATKTLGKARPRAQELYKQLVRHALFDQLEVKTSVKANKVDYAFEVASSKLAKSAREARNVLSDGQLTAAALALFYALAESCQHGLDLLYIDDPTQNMDHLHKEAMAKVVSDLAKRKQIIVSTQDEDFVTLLRDAGFEECGVVHHLHSWDRRPEVKTTMPRLPA